MLERKKSPHPRVSIGSPSPAFDLTMKSVISIRRNFYFYGIRIILSFPIKIGKTTPDIYWLHIKIHLYIYRSKLWQFYSKLDIEKIQHRDKDVTETEGLQ